MCRRRPSQVCDGFKIFGDLGPLIGTLRERGIRVGAWGYSYLNRSPLKEAGAVLDACQRYEPDFYLITVESEVEGNHGGARMFLNELRPAMAGVPLGLNTFWNVAQHPKFPWVEFMSRVDFVCPLVYWRGVDPVGKLIAAQQSYAGVPTATDAPMPYVVIGCYMLRRCHLNLTRRVDPGSMGHALLSRSRKLGVRLQK